MRRHMRGRNELKQESYGHIDAARVTWIGAAINLALALFKVAAGILGSSAAMLSDGGHSFSDLVSDGLTLITLRMSALPPDDDHPYGHGRFESLGSLAIASVLLLAGISFGANAYGALCTPSPTPLGKIALWAALASILSKELLFRATRRVGLRINSQVMLANAWHHRSDALSSIVAIIGIWGSLLGLRMLDPIAGLVVAAMVSWMGMRIGMDALLQLSDTSNFETVQAVQQSAEAVPGVLQAAHIRSRSMGGDALVDLAIQVDPILSASAAHKIAEEVRWGVLSDVPLVSEVLVHVDTTDHDTTCPLQDQVMQQARSHLAVEAQVRHELKEVEEMRNVTSVLVHYLPDGLAVDVQAMMADHLCVAQLRHVAELARRRLMRAAPDIRSVRVSVDLQADDVPLTKLPVATSTVAAGVAASGVAMPPR
eukprot:CAMPEP_0119323282 /NCGR_PEP_ID=MMETSP1333-20130426/60411_1 /TAXON_ID=418940 /ORGANISM="Scyphosphaera apsteinii, Strain RCC1455" /LENGTH=425 /DNA_ID=CAMNT_0007330685 /DNA_START=269 /DNA_END=1546 /DNA_ORIENTATION=-